MTVLQLKKEELHELLVEYTRSNNVVTSNLLGELKQNQQELKDITLGHGYKIDTLNGTVTKIEAQTVKTNGRVSSLEKWKWTVVGGMTVLAAMGIPNLVLFAKAFTGQ